MEDPLLTAAALVALHLLALLSCIVFLAGRSALLRPELGEARRALGPVLRRLDRVYWVALLTLGATGGLLVFLGPYGPAFYSQDILLGLMALGWLAVVVQAVLASRRLGRLIREEPPVDEGAFSRLRSSLMAQGHIMGLVALFGVFLAFGYGGR